jgi:hypothetical protein
MLAGYWVPEIERMMQMTFARNEGLHGSEVGEHLELSHKPLYDGFGTQVAAEI